MKNIQIVWCKKGVLLSIQGKCRRNVRKSGTNIRKNKNTLIPVGRCNYNLCLNHKKNVKNLLFRRHPNGQNKEQNR